MISAADRRGWTIDRAVPLVKAATWGARTATSATRAAARTALLAAGVLATLLLWPADPAAAASCSVRLEGLLAASSIGTATEFGAVLTNDTPDAALPQLRLRVHVTLNGLTPAGVLVERRDGGAWQEVTDKSASDGDVKAVDQGISLAAGASMTRQYRLTVLPGAPTGTATVSAATLTRTDSGWTVIGRSSKYLVAVTQPAPGGGGSTRTSIVTSGAAQSGSTSANAAQAAPSANPNSPGASSSAHPTPNVGGHRGRSNAASTKSTDQQWPVRARLITAVLTTTVVILLVMLSWLIWRRSVTAEPPAQEEPTTPRPRLGPSAEEP